VRSNHESARSQATTPGVPTLGQHASDNVNGRAPAAGADRWVSAGDLWNLAHSGECLSLGRESSGWLGVHGHAEGFFEGGESFADLCHRVVTQGDGPVLGGVAMHGLRRGLLGDEAR
jgi:hypothetical protein